MSLTLERFDSASLEAWAERDRVIRSIARTPRCDLALRYFDIRQATGVEDARWQPFQYRMLNETSPFLSLNKSRQIGASFTFAADTLMEGLTQDRRTYIYVSYNLEEAKEKIIYAKQWWDSRQQNPQLIPAYGEFDDHGNWRGVSPRRVAQWPELIKQTAFELQWSNGLRLISHPCRPPRGKKASVILDELAHYQNAGAIYTAAMPMMTRGKGLLKLWIASTPLGARDKFWEIHTDERQYPDFVRFDFGWWEVDDLCTDRHACMEAWRSGADHRELIHRYGTRQLKLLYRNAVWEDFLQEYCLQFLDAVHSFLSWDLIRSCYPLYWDPEQDEELDWEAYEQELARDYENAYVGYKGRGLDQCINAIDELAKQIGNGRVTPNLVWSYDCGRDRDVSEICLMENAHGRSFQRLMLTMPQMAFSDQKSVIRHMLKVLPTRRGWMDKGSIGRQVAEEVEKWGYGAEGVTFTTERKELWALTLKRTMEAHRLTLIPDREQEQQLHSIQKRITDASNMKYEIEDSYATVGGGKKIKHHADKFWVVAMATTLSGSIDAITYESAGTSNDELVSKAYDVAQELERKGFSSASPARIGTASRAREVSNMVNNKMRRR